MLQCPAFFSWLILLHLSSVICTITPFPSQQFFQMQVNQTSTQNTTLNVNESNAQPSKPIAIVTGANSGLGKECCRQLAGVHGFKTIMACRNLQACKAARDEILRCHPEADLECAKLDLACLRSVSKFAHSHIADRPVKALVHNAGVMAVPFNRTYDGFETTFQVNHLGPFYLTRLLLPNMGFKVHEEGSRVVCVASGAHYFGRFDPTNIPGERMYNRWLAYCNTKMYNVMFASELHRRYKEQGITSFSMRPGTIATDIGRHSFLVQASFKFLRPFLTPVQEGAGAVVYAVLSPLVENQGNHSNFFNKFVPATPSFTAKNRAFCKQLWEHSEKLIQSWKEKQIRFPKNTEAVKERWRIQKT